jgi:hypothetical protein
MHSLDECTIWINFYFYFSLNVQKLFDVICYQQKCEMRASQQRFVISVRRQLSSYCVWVLVCPQVLQSTYSFFAFMMSQLKIWLHNRLPYSRCSDKSRILRKNLAPSYVWLCWNSLGSLTKSGLHYQSFCDHSRNFAKVNSIIVLEDF